MELPVATRETIVSVASDIHQWADREEDVVYPEAGSRPVPCLTVFKNGFQCKELELGGVSCRYTIRTLKDMQEHYCKKYGKVRASGLWAEGVCCQKFQNTGRLGQLFEVSMQGEGGVRARWGEAGASERRWKILSQSGNSTMVYTIIRQKFCRAGQNRDPHQH